MNKRHWKIPLRICPSFWVISVLLGWLNTHSLEGILIWIPFILISLIAHEYGHALTAVWFGQRATVELSFIGGITRHAGAHPLKSWQECLVLINGPLAGAVLIAMSYLGIMFLGDRPFGEIILIFGAMNAFWTLFNLLPIYPLDGGQLVAVILRSLFGARGFSAALLMSTLFGMSLGIFALVYGLLFFAAFAFILSIESYRQWRQSSSMSDNDYSAAHRQQLQRAENLLAEGNRTEALSLLLQIASTTDRGLIHDAAVARLADLYLSQGQNRAAYSLLQPYASRLSDQMVPLFIRAAYLCGDWAGASAYTGMAYRLFPSWEIALLNARIHARLDEVVPTIGWLECAIDSGAKECALQLDHPDFDAIRHSQDFRSLLDTLNDHD